MKVSTLILLTFLFSLSKQQVKEKDPKEFINILNIVPKIISQTEQVFLHVYYIDDNKRIPYWKNIQSFEQFALIYEMPLEKNENIEDLAKNYLEVESIPCVVYFPPGNKRQADYTIFDLNDSFKDVIQELEEKQRDLTYHINQASYNQFLHESLEMKKLSFLYIPKRLNDTNEEYSQFFFQKLVAKNQELYPNKMRYAIIQKISQRFLDKFKIQKLPALLALHDKFKFNVLQNLTTQNMRQFMLEEIITYENSYVIQITNEGQYNARCNENIEQCFFAFFDISYLYNCFIIQINIFQADKNSLKQNKRILQQGQNYLNSLNQTNSTISWFNFHCFYHVLWGTHIRAAETKLPIIIAYNPRTTQLIQIIMNNYFHRYSSLLQNINQFKKYIYSVFNQQAFTFYPPLLGVTRFVNKEENVNCSEIMKKQYKQQKNKITQESQFIFIQKKMLFYLELAYKKLKNKLRSQAKTIKKLQTKKNKKPSKKKSKQNIDQYKAEL